MTVTARGPRTVGSLMTDDPIIVNVEMPLAEVAELLDFYQISGLPVVDQDGSLAGVISRTDLLHVRTTEELWRAWPWLAVRDLMSRPAVTVSSTMAVDDAAKLMERLRIHRLVVVDIDGETPIGLLSITDLVHAMAEEGPS